MMPAAMIDIETIDTCPEAVVLSVGACKFDPYSNAEPHGQTHWRISIEEQLTRGRTASDSTIEWWARQDPKIRDAAFSEEGRIPVETFMAEFNRWLVGVDKIWCQGPQFDMVILENLFTQFGVHKNWAYWQVCDSRTLFNLMPEDPRKSIRQQAHDALADAYYQALSVQKVYKHFGIRPRFDTQSLSA